MKYRPDFPDRFGSLDRSRKGWSRQIGFQPGFWSGPVFDWLAEEEPDTREDMPSLEAAPERHARPREKAAAALYCREVQGDERSHEEAAPGLEVIAGGSL